MGFIFYDTETTGLTAGFDQILQFAAVVTDDDLNVIEEVNLRCRLQPHVIPSPGALVITGVRPSDIARANLSHYEMIREIRALIERCTPSVIVGYNSISYDENMLRQAFYQTLNPVYLTNTNGNTRMDVLRLAHAVSEYAPDVLEVPINAKGRPFFKLEALAMANNLMHEEAHEAMSDTLATLALARLARDRAPAVWEAMLNTRNKQLAHRFIDEQEVFCFTDKAFKQSSILATKISANPDNPAEVAIYDLSHDPVHYLDVAKNDMKYLLKTSPRPIRIVKTNQNPILTPISELNAGISGHDVPEATLLERARAVQGHPDFADNVADAVANRYPTWPDAEYVEQRIYEGFPSRADQNLMEAFHRAPWDERLEIVGQLEDDRYRELGERLIWAERPDVLDEGAQQRHDGWCRERLQAEGNVPWVTVGKAVDEYGELKASGRGEEHLLNEIEASLRS